jgi:hypothetical protein
MSIRMCYRLQLQELSSQFPDVDMEKSRGWGTLRQRLGEEFIVCLGNRVSSY